MLACQHVFPDVSALHTPHALQHLPAWQESYSVLSRACVTAQEVRDNPRMAVERQDFDGRQRGFREGMASEQRYNTAALFGPGPSAGAEPELVSDGPNFPDTPEGTQASWAVFRFRDAPLDGDFNPDDCLVGGAKVCKARSCMCLRA